MGRTERKWKVGSSVYNLRISNSMFLPFIPLIGCNRDLGVRHGPPYVMCEDACPLYKLPTFRLSGGLHIIG